MGAGEALERLASVNCHSRGGSSRLPGRARASLEERAARWTGAFQVVWLRAGRARV